MIDRTLTTIVAVTALALCGVFGEAAAGPDNQIGAVAIDDDRGTTTIRLRGSDTPTFTVYKLERPTRVVVDLASAALTDAVRGDDAAVTFPVGSWAVGQVAAMSLEDGSAGVRVVATLARPGRYDVRADGKDVIITVTARDPAPTTASPAALAAAHAAAAAAKTDAERARAEAARTTAAANAATAAAKTDAERARAEAARTTAAANAATAAAKTDAERARAEAARMTAAANAATAAAAAAKRDAEAAKREAAAAKVAADAEARRAASAATAAAAA
ncbi:MAG: AMIN domain-containing protein, partial [Kofleriaceae bacterium]|nr:AMIN domain-containing protein [Kofleriaceae bacterium]